ncbi:retinoblastoma-like protein 1 isoform X2 [Leptinotarsa decemlineata]|uniref:retinoblastoma-like protein 1 isoform X2 n=1 Tax=Leptinotarsa decemlineata TaxID=7539 RepID=UPI000C25583F|nr:retinoblastoma-like protein 1 isoform X2 [Leptinotarsa decemlineata]
MVLPDGEDELNKKLLDLCNKLSLDPRTTTVAWEKFSDINKNFVLEGESIHWLGCAVFVASQSVETPTLLSTVVRGNCINLTSLLRYSNLSFVQFFNNIRKWSEMSPLNNDLKEKIKHLEDTFGVAHNTFKEYYPLFSRIFLPPTSQDLDQSKHRNRKQRPVSCNTSKVFEFLWNLFITLKGEDSQYSSELIKSYHLLYACLDLAFKNAFLTERRDLLNPQFEGLPSNWNQPDFVVPSEAPCIISYLCKSPSMLTDALHMKTYDMKTLMSTLVLTETVLADRSTFIGFLNRDVFEQNFKNITNTYETRLLSKAEVDERIFLAEYRRQLLEHQQMNCFAQGARASPFRETGENTVLASPRNNEAVATPRGSDVFDTPLTGRQYLGPREADVSPFQTDRNTNQKITRLQAILNNRSPCPSETLKQLFESTQTDPSQKIQEILTSLGDKFVAAYAGQNGEEEAKSRLQMGITLFYKFVENILQNEKTMRADISALVEKGLFYECMFTCCLEIVLFCYNSPNKFPWLLDVFDVQPFHFVKVIELIVRTRDQLWREMVKYLNKIEETVLESLVWKSNSRIWEMIANSGQDIPKFSDTALPGHLLYNDQNQSTESPTPSATDRFQSPVSGAVSRQLFSSIQPGQSVLQRHTHIMITDREGNKKLIPIVDSTSQLPKRTGSLSIIFRKFYNLAGVRMEHLCNKLGLVDIELKRKIWTVFEDSVRNSDLIKDRHLDQLLMCAIYVICRISSISLKFQDIMKFYREQPQSSSSVYRDVLLKREGTDDNGPHPEERSDLIYFYNSKYVEVMQKFAIRFRSSSQSANLLLSPLPAIKRDLVSPSIQVVSNVYVRPLENSAAATGGSFNYFFSRSPSKDLKDINKLVNSNNRVVGKRLLTENDLDSNIMPPSKRISNRKLQSLVEERRSQNTE